MNNIWLINIEEAGAVGNTSCRYDSKYFWNIQNEDVLITPKVLDFDHLSYILNIKKISKFTLIETDVYDKSKLPTESILENKELLLKLKKLQGYVLRPYIETERTNRLRKAISSKWYSIERNKNYTYKMNCKSYFKKICKKIDIPIARCVSLQSFSGYPIYTKQIRKLAHKYPDLRYFVIKKDYCVGGYGNERLPIHGYHLINKEWLGEDRFTIEAYEDISKTIGVSLSISKDDVKIQGLDEQNITELKWEGLAYPLKNLYMSHVIREYAYRFGQYLRKKRMYGNANIDFGVNEINGNEFQCYAFECNFRENGLKIFLSTLDLLHCSDRYASYNNNYRFTQCTFSEVSAFLSKITLNCESILFSHSTRVGCLISDVDQINNTVGIICIARSREELIEIEELVKQSIINTQCRTIELDRVVEIRV